MIRILPALCFLFFCSITGKAQITALDLDPARGCSYAGEESLSGAIYGFDSSNEAQEVVQNILRQVGLTPNFTIKAANVPNAQAHVSKGERYILYSEQFMAAIYNQTGDYWSQVAILAHEIGHHLNGHTLQLEGSRPVLELEADKFSGFVLFKLGANLQQSQAAVTALSSDEGSATHPPKSARLEAIAVGFREARELSSQTGSEEKQETGAGGDAREEAAPARPPDNTPLVKEGRLAFAGQEYATVTVNGQTWLNENLNAPHRNSWCAGNAAKNCTSYGRLYNWTAANKLCSELGEGWRLPTREDWQGLVDYLQENPSGEGISMQYGGYGDLPSQARSQGEKACFWTASHKAADYHYVYIFLNGDNVAPQVEDALYSKGRSVRCVKD